MCLFEKIDDNLNQPLYRNNRCVFCLKVIDVNFKGINYNVDSFFVNDKKYLLNCPCRPAAHYSCMNFWLMECARCPECSVYLTETEFVRYEKKCCTYYNLLVCLAVVLIIAIIILISICYYRRVTINIHF